ncbi:hypothetical protein BaRGS_00037021, partial [Batillaria attramentaria]
SQTVSVATTTYSTSAHADTRYRAGTCTFSSTDVSTTDKYYKAVVYPGATSTVYGPLNVEHPDSPRLTCSPSPYVPEESTVSCTCSTQSVGKPSGRLRWFKGNDNNNVINSGNYGNTKLNMTPQTLSRSDHGAVFRCDVDWIKPILGGKYNASLFSCGASVLTAREPVTARPALVSTLHRSSITSILTDCTIICSCVTGKNVYTLAIIVYSRRKHLPETCPRQQQMKNMISVNVRDLRDEFTTHLTALLKRIDSLESENQKLKSQIGEQKRTINSLHQTARQVKSETSYTQTENHVPSQLTSSQQSLISTSGVQSQSDTGNTRDPPCHVDVDIDSDARSPSPALLLQSEPSTQSDDTKHAGDARPKLHIPERGRVAYFQRDGVHLNNRGLAVLLRSIKDFLYDRGSATDIDSLTLTVPREVTENQSVTFTCRADGRPTPSVALANRYNGTELASQSSPLSYSVSRARCEDAGAYTCTASNEIGRTTMDGVLLRVKSSATEGVGLPSARQVKVTDWFSVTSRGT